MPSTATQLAMNPTLVLDEKKTLPEDFASLIKTATFLCCPKNEETSNLLYAFTTETAYRAWAKAQGVVDHYDEAKNMVRKAKTKKLTPAQLKDLEHLHSSRVLAETKRIEQLLKRKAIDLRNITRQDIQKLKQLETTAEHVGGPILGSCWLFDLPGLNGAWRYLSPGLYPKFSWFGFNDRADSAITLWPEVAILYRHTWWGGETFAVQGVRNYLYWFANRASSAVVY